MPNWKLKVFKEWSAAVGNDDRDEKFQALKEGLPGIEEKDLAANTKDLLKNQYPGANAAEIGRFAQWLAGIQQWGRWDLSTTRTIVERLHKEVNAGMAGAGERDRVSNWLNTLYSNGNGVQKKHINAFTFELDKKLIKGKSKDQMEVLLSNGFFDSVQTMIALGGGENAKAFPKWLPSAIEHKQKVSPGETFWISTLHDAGRIRDIGDALYANNDWKAPKANIANDYATMLGADASERLVLMFPTLSMWADIAGEAVQQGGIADLPQKLVDISRARTGALEKGTLADLGTWIWTYRKAVLGLIRLGYSPEVIAKMQEVDLTHREIITTTWFRGERADMDDKLAVGFKMRNQTNTDDQHGYYFGPTRHLAERHLYKNFQFNAQPEAPWDKPIKAENSFHPRGTTQANLASLREKIKLPYQGKNLINIVERQADNRDYVLIVDSHEGGRVRTLYPRNYPGHRDYYTEDQLTRIKTVAAQFPQAYPNILPELPWVDP